MKGTKPTHLLRAEVKQIFEVWLTNEQAKELMAPEGYVKISTESKLFENLVSMDIPSVKLDGQELPDSCYLKIDKKGYVCGEQGQFLAVMEFGGKKMKTSTK